MKKHMRIRISGKVQGVFFRQYVYDHAIAHQIVGFVHNCEDGTVLIECVGEEDRLNEFIAACKKGPVRAEVKNMELRDVHERAQFTSFIIQ